MIDIKLLQKDFDTVSVALQKKGVTTETLASLKTQVEDAKKKRKEIVLKLLLKEQERSLTY